MTAALRMMAGTWLCASVILVAHGAAADTTVFSTDFEDGLPIEFSAPGAAVEGVQGYEGLGTGNNKFDGSFLRYTSTGISDTTLTIENLPEHNVLSLEFLLAVIDSWDGEELLEVRIDGKLLFSHWFSLAQADSSSYSAPEGGLLSSGTDLGFTSGSFFAHDRAYDMSLEEAFQQIDHEADSVTINWSLGATSGTAAGNWQGGADESWAIENVRVGVEILTGVCSQPVTNGPAPKVTDCLYVLRTAVGTSRCRPGCICAPKGQLPATATDSLVCLRKAVGQAIELNCPCLFN